MVEALEKFQEQNGLKIDGYAKPGGPTERAINNNLLGKPRGAGLLHDFAMAVGDTVGNGFANAPRDVATVKRALGGLGYLPEDPFDRPSGFIEESTTKAIQRFQSDNRLSADGWLAPGGETDAALRQAVDRLARVKRPEWLEYRRRTPAPSALQEAGYLDDPAAVARRAGRMFENARRTDGADVIELREPGAHFAGTVATDSGTASRSAHSPSVPQTEHGIGDVAVDPEANFGSWSFRRDAVLPEGVTPPSDPLERDVLGGVPSDGMSEPDVGIDRKREVRFLISRLYRAGARDEGGRHRLGDEAFERYIAAAKEHIKPEHFAIFELTARAVRAGALDWHVAATRLAAYYAPGTTGEKIVDFILDFTPVAGQVKAVKELVEAVQDAIDAKNYGDEKAFGLALTKAGGASAAIAIPGALAGVSRLLRKELHHLFPLYLGGGADGPTVPMTAFWHRLWTESVHSKMNRYFRENHSDLVPKRGYKGEHIVARTTSDYRNAGLDAFYRTFEHSTRPHEVRTYRQWIKMFPEATRKIPG